MDFAKSQGVGLDPFLALLSNDEQELFTKAFIQCYRHAHWTTSGDFTGNRSRPVVSGTVRQATSHVAATFRSNLRPSPMHNPGGTHLKPFVRSLLKAYDNDDPAKLQQRAITPKLLRAMFLMSGAEVTITKDTPFAIISELAIMAYFFAMRSCEFTLTPQRGRTKIIRLRGITFRDKDNHEVPHTHCDLTTLAHRVTLTFENQKNGLKMDRRTHQGTTDRALCPVKRLASLVERILRTVPGAGPDTPINTAHLNGKAVQISGAALRKHMRSTCTAQGGKPTFGYTAADIGTKSIRSGAAMGLFLMNHPVHRIMILGRWSSDAFLVYIRPQVLKWTNNMSQDMIKINSFTDAIDSRMTATTDPRTRQKLFNGENNHIHVAMQEMNLHH